MNLRQLEAFFAVAETLHFGRAAERLFIAQSSISESVSVLESELGEPLLMRTSRRVSLTPFGVEFLHEVKPRYDALMSSIQGFRHLAPDARALKIGHTPELGHWLFPELFRATEALPAEARPSWKPMLMHTPAQVAAVADGSIDLGLCWEPVVPATIEKRVLARCPFVAVLRDDDPLCERATLTVADLRGRHLLVSPRANNSVLDSKLQSALSSAGLERTALEEVSGYNEISIHVLTSRAVGVHPALIAGMDRNDGVQFRLIDDDELWVDVCLISRRVAAGERHESLAKILAAAASGAIAVTESALTGFAEARSRRID